MDLILILLIIGLGLVFFLAFKLFKRLFKAAISVFVIMILLVVLSGIIIYNDAMTLKEGLSGDQIMMITHDEKIITAFKPSTDVPVSSMLKTDFYELLSEEEIEELYNLVIDNKKEELEEEGFLIIIEQEVFFNETINLNDGEINMTEDMLIGIGESTSSQDIIEILRESEELSEEELLALTNKEVHELKSQVYYSLLAKKMKDTKGTFLINEMKNGRITTIPRLLSIKTLNFFPDSIMKRMASKEMDI